MVEYFPFIVSLIGLFFLLTNCIRYTKKLKFKGNVKYRLLAVYLVLLFVVEVFCNVMGFLKPGSNFFLSHYYFGFQFICLSFFFYNVFTEVWIKKLIQFVLIGVFIFLGVQYVLEPELYWKFNVWEIGVTSILLIAYGLIYLFSNFDKPSHEYFYFCNGMIIYVASSCSIFLTGNQDSVILEKPFVLDFWFFNSLFYILYQFFIYKEWCVLNSSEGGEEPGIVEKTV